MQACAADYHIPGRLAQRFHDGRGADTVMVEEENCSMEVLLREGSKFSYR